MDKSTIDASEHFKNLDGIENFLNKRALELSKKQVNSNGYVDNDGTFHPCVYLTRKAPLNDGALDESYIKRWANMLNFLADSGLWQHGALAKWGQVKLANIIKDWDLKNGVPAEYGPAKEVAIYSFIFVNGALLNKFGDELIEKLNDFIGAEVFFQEGQIPEVVKVKVGSDKAVITYYSSFPGRDFSYNSVLNLPWSARAFIEHFDSDWHVGPFEFSVC